MLGLCASDDLYRWRVVKTLLQDDSGLLPEDSVRLTGYQYVDWQFDGDDLIYVVRTASRGAQLKSMSKPYQTEVNIRASIGPRPDIPHISRGHYDRASRRVGYTAGDASTLGARDWSGVVGRR